MARYQMNATTILPSGFQMRSISNVAVLVSGQMRTASRCAEAIRALYPDADFYVHAVKDDQADDAMLFRPRAVMIEPQYEMPERREYSIQIGRGCHGVQRVLKQLWGLARVWSLYRSFGVQHEYIVRMRPDIQFLKSPCWDTDRCQLDSRAADVLVPMFCNWFGYNDRFAIGRYNAMHQYFNRLDLVDEYINAGGIFHPETFLAWSLRRLRVGRTEAVFHTLRPDGTTDDPVYVEAAGDIVR